ncbi:pentapeptide repeat-containing protein [Saccharothrix luteola]|uniref:pentapeptide repeat-containing protein n=1 Tax=Saccharothrix luteola TaxID=2893018 RepID=UPI001E40038C|nr:pentapeptide repeat-containing protein [Saccharothrix luteola]MCC8250198.1 pentapeptide repeat-containing protein [Saccharothrix luteola]
MPTIAQTVTALITAATAIGALIFTGLSLNATRDQVAAAQAQNRVTEQGQFTDRYTKAIEQIGQQGADRLQVRLGGIYALERLAHDSPRDQSTIIEVLSAFVRTNAPRPPLRPFEDASCPDQTVSPDVQAALTVMGRRNGSKDEVRVNLTSVCLIRANLDGANFSGADFSGSYLSEASLVEANLAGADMRANLGRTDMTRASLVGAKMSIAWMQNAVLYEADLTGAKMNDANLSGANLYHADLTGADLTNANLVIATATGATLIRTDLTSADFSHSSLKDARLLGTRLIDTNLTSSDLSGAFLAAVDHSGTVVQDVVVDSHTTGIWW